MDSLPNANNISMWYTFLLVFGIYTILTIRPKPSVYPEKVDQQAIQNNAMSFPQMRRWSQAGTTKQIPDVHNSKAHVVLHGGSSEHINEKITELELDLQRNGGKYRVLLLKNGVYHINDRVRMKSNIILKGQSRDGVRCIVNMTSRSAFYIGDIEGSGIYRMTIMGSWGRPKRKWNIGNNKKNKELPGNSNISVYFSKLARDCWIDNVKILDSANFPLRCAGQHITMRNLVVNRVHNKHAGSHGYWIILGRDNLITKSKATQLRHISIQGNRAEYNVLYDNNFEQEISFHVGDQGNNLIEHNRITLPKGMPNGSNGRPDYRAIMGPWSYVHEKSKVPNFLHENTLLERNHGDMRRMTDDKVYKGPIFETANGEEQTRNFPASEQKPIGGTLYPIRF